MTTAVARSRRARGTDTAPASAPAVSAVHILHPGDVACGTTGDRLETLLGSCVSIVLTDPRRTVGTMCHIVHSRPSQDLGRKSAAHGEGALAAMYALLQARGIAPRLCEAWVFGGGNMFPALVRDNHVGDTNAQWAFYALAADGIRVLGHDVGGATYRRLAWTVGPGAPEVTAFDV